MDKNVKIKIENFFSEYRPSTFKKNEIIFRPGDTINDVYLLKSGTVRMYALSPDGKEITLHIFRPLSYFPIMLSLSNSLNKYYFESVENVNVVKAPVHEVTNFLKNEPEVLFDLTNRFSDAICGLLLRIESMTFEDSYSRIANLFIYLAQKFGNENDNKIIISIPMGHEDIANWIGIRRETVSRQFEKMQKEGIVASANKQIIILDLPKLQSAGEKSL